MTGPEGHGEPGKSGAARSSGSGAAPVGSRGRGRPRFGRVRDHQRLGARRRAGAAAETLGFDSSWIADHPLSTAATHGTTWPRWPRSPGASGSVRWSPAPTTGRWRSSPGSWRTWTGSARPGGARHRDRRQPAQLGPAGRPVPPVPRGRRRFAARRVLRPLLAGEEVELPGGDRVVLRRARCSRGCRSCSPGRERVRSGRSPSSPTRRTSAPGAPWAAPGRWTTCGASTPCCGRTARRSAAHESVLRTHRRPPPRGGRRDARGSETSALGHRYLGLQADPPAPPRTTAR